MSDILHIRGELWNPSCINWTLAQPAREIAGAVQIAAEFTVQRADGTVLHGQADDYLVTCADGTLVPVPQNICLILIRPVITALESDAKEQSNDGH